MFPFPAGVAVRVVTRQGSQLLGINGRNDGPVVNSTYWYIGLMVHRYQLVLGLVPKEGDGERFEDALARVCRCIGGGAATENADSDSDLEVVADSVTVSLRCPVNEWFSDEDSRQLQNCGEDVNEIDVKPDGCWRVRNENEFNDLSKWHMPDGSLCVNTYTEVKPDLEKLKQIKQEDTSEVHRSLKLKRNRKGLWEFSKPDNTRLQSSQNHDFSKLEDHFQIMPMSSSASGSYRDVEDLIVNQEAAGCSGLSLNRRHEPSSPALNIESTYAVGNTFHSSPRNSQDVIVLSDSDEDNPTLISPETTYDTRPIVDSGIPFPSPPRGSEGFLESTALGMRTSGSILLDNNTDDFAMPLWPIHASPQAGPGFQLFGANAEIQDPLVDSDNSLGCVLTDGYGLASNGGLGDTSRLQNRSTCHSSTELHGSLVDNPLAFCSDDPSLQIFLPSRPTGIPLQDDLDDRPEVPNGVTSDDWISLTLAGGDGGSAPSTRPRSGQQHTPKESRMEPLDGAGLYLLDKTVTFFS
ncbi:hypothetical protein GW17_00020471 [Ensete ventricosum]|nr:hypothetical protein GW17_00020471 [Ensete ventricosum]